MGYWVELLNSSSFFSNFSFDHLICLDSDEAVAQTEQAVLGALKISKTNLLANENNEITVHFTRTTQYEVNLFHGLLNKKFRLFVQIENQLIKTTTLS